MELASHRSHLKQPRAKGCSTVLALVSILEAGNAMEQYPELRMKVTGFQNGKPKIAILMIYNHQ